MLVSIITPCLNSVHTIKQTIESVLRQTYKNIEYIIIDGGSTDGTVGIIKECMPLFCGRMRYVSEPDKGIYNAMNKGIRMSRGQLIGIINSDDFYEEDAAMLAAGCYRAGRSQVIYGYLRVIQERRPAYIHRRSHNALMQGMIPHPTCFVTRNVYREYGLYLEKFRLASDYELMMRVYKKGAVEFECIPRVMANFRCGGASESSRIRHETSFIRLWHGGLTLKEFADKAIRDCMLYGI